MSVFEIVGVVLAAVPILVGVLKRAGDSIKKRKEPLKCLVSETRFEEILDTLINNLEFQRISLESTVQALLLESGACSKERVDEHGAVLLEDADVSITVGEYLGKESKRALLNSMKTSTDRHKLQQFTCKAARKSLLKRAVDKISPLKRYSESSRFSAFNSDINKLKTAIDDVDKLLSKITSNHQIRLRLAKAPAKANDEKAEMLSRVRRLADRLYHTLPEHFCYDKECRHQAKLLLENRFTSIEETTAALKDNPKAPVRLFTVIVSATRARPKDVISSSWFEVAISSVAVLPYGDFIAVDYGFFCKMETSTEEYSKSTLAILNDGQLGTLPRRALQETGPLFRRYPGSTKTITFRDVLKNLGHEKDAIKRSARMLLALNLAFSFVQLLNTNWLVQPLSKETITFLEDPSVGSPMSEMGQPGSYRLQIDFERPFVPYIGRNWSAGDACENLQKNFLELAILLLEIWHLTPIEKEFPENRDLEKFEIRRNLLYEWLVRIQTPPSVHEGWKKVPGIFYDALFYCLVRATTPLPKADKAWLSGTLSKEILISVVEPLAKCSECGL